MTTNMESRILDDFRQAGGKTHLIESLLRASANVETYDVSSMDVRLRWHDGEFYFLTGDASYDQDHRGHWGASSVGYFLTPELAASIADDLLEQVLDDACCGLG